MIKQTVRPAVVSVSPEHGLECEYQCHSHLLNCFVETTVAGSYIHFKNLQ